MRLRDPGELQRVAVGAIVQQVVLETRLSAHSNFSGQEDDIMYIINIYICIYIYRYMHMSVIYIYPKI